MRHCVPACALWFLLSMSPPALPQAIQRIRFAHLVSKVEPVWPVAPKKRGTVRLDIVIGKDGHVRSAKAISGRPAVVAAARRAVLQWVYTPTLVNGEPTEVVMEVRFPASHRRRGSLRF